MSLKVIRKGITSSFIGGLPLDGYYACKPTACAFVGTIIDILGAK